MSAIEVDTTRLPLLLHELRLPAIARLWSEFADRSRQGVDGRPRAFLAALAELEIAERGRQDASCDISPKPVCRPVKRSTISTSPLWFRCSARRVSLHLPPVMPGSTRHPTCCVLGRQVPVGQEPPCVSNRWSSCRERGYRALFTRTTDIVQKLQAARQALQLEAAINRLDRYDLLILDDLSYVHKRSC